MCDWRCKFKIGNIVVYGDCFKLGIALWIWFEKLRLMPISLPGYTLRVTSLLDLGGGSSRPCSVA